MKHLALFNGIGGFQLAASWVEWENVAHVEIDPFCNKVVGYHFPESICHTDIKQFDGTQYRGTIDILSGGPPCQPASSAGKRKGENDDRWLWWEAIRVLGEIKPGFAIFENPDDLLSLDNGKSFERICCQMEDYGYSIETYGLPACCVGAWHERDRIWIIAYSNNISNQGELDNRGITETATGSKSANGSQRKTQNRKWIRSELDKFFASFPYTNSHGLPKSACSQFASIYRKTEALTGREFSGTLSEIGKYWETEPGVVRMVHGLPNRVDRIKSLGNSIVPQIAYEIFKAIDQIERGIETFK